MCTQPIAIKKNNFKYILFSKKVLVPCGNCPECNKRKANDLFVRAKLEYDYCLKHGGCGFMCCLTYSDDLVPTIEIDGRKVMVFAKQDVIDFVKRLRTNLDRKYQEMFNRNAPDFKYLITSEYGTDPTRSHRPHYHPLFFFAESLLPSIFRQAFVESLKNRVTGKSYFGKIYQCDLIDPKKGGIQYASKYVCKDLMYKYQSDFIKKRIDYYRELVCQKHGILPCDSADNEFHNKCVRSTKAYKKDIETYVRPWSHMLQFFMLSNDLGATAAIEKYGDSLEVMPSFNFDGFPYAIPKLIKDKYERIYGYNASLRLAKSCFINFLERVLSFFVSSKTITRNECNDLLVFARSFLYPIGGGFRLMQPSDFDCLNILNNGQKWCDIVEQFKVFHDSDFFVMRDRIQSLLAMYNSPENLKYRAEIRIMKDIHERQKYITRKRNNQYVF